MGNSKSKKSNKLCRCQACSHCKVYKEASFLSLEKINDSILANSSQIKNKSFLLCFDQCISSTQTRENVIEFNSFNNLF